MTLDGFLAVYFLACGSLSILGAGKSLFKDGSLPSFVVAVLWGAGQFTLMYLVWTRTP